MGYEETGTIRKQRWDFGKMWFLGRQIAHNLCGYALSRQGKRSPYSLAVGCAQRLLPEE